MKLLITLAVVGLLALMVFFSKKNRFTSDVDFTGQRLFPDFPAEVSSISVKDSEGEVNFNLADGKWTVAERDYAADVGRMQRLVRNLKDVKILNSLKIGESRHGQMKLLAPGGEGADEEKTGTLVTFKDSGGKELRHVMVGKSVTNTLDTSGGPMGTPRSSTSRYLMASNQEGQVFEVEEDFARISGESDSWPSNFEAIDSSPGEWVLKEFVKVKNVKSVDVAFRNGAVKGWKLTRENDTGDFTLVDTAKDEELDTSKTGTYKNILSSPTVKDVLTEEMAGKLDMGQGADVKIETFDGFNYALEVGPKDTETNTIPVKVAVAANIPTERPKDGDAPAKEVPADESEDDKKKREEAEAAAEKKKDEDFAKEREELTKKLAEEKKIEGRFFSLNSWSVDALVKPREDLLKKEEEEDAKAGAGAGSGAVAPPGLGAGAEPLIPAAPPKKTSSVSVRKKSEKPVAVTEPIPVPPLPPKKKERVEAYSPPVAVPPIPDKTEEASKSVSEGKPKEAVSPPVAIPPLPDTSNVPSNALKEAKEKIEAVSPSVELKPADSSGN